MFVSDTCLSSYKYLILSIRPVNSLALFNCSGLGLPFNINSKLQDLTHMKIKANNFITTTPYFNFYKFDVLQGIFNVHISPRDFKI